MANNKEIAEIKLIESQIKLSNNTFIENNNNNNIHSTILGKAKLKFEFSKDHGKLGLKNLGNTCYMNCALQVMAHTKELVSYMMTDYQQQDILETNDLELLYKRQILSEFANIVKEEWTSTRNEPIIPREFKFKFISIYNQFDNSCQQDAHEFLTCFLNTLHECLLRIDNITEEQQNIPFSRNLSNICWDNHVKFNGESFITDIFFGQLKSTIKCKNCLYESNVYEAFDCLGLTTPKEFKILLYFVPLNKNHKPIKMFVKVNDTMQYRNILNIVKSQIEYPFDTGIFYYVFNNKLSQIVSLEERSGDLLNRNLFLFLIETISFKEEKINCNQIYNNTFICLNTFMIEDQTNKEVENLKEASFPRIFPLYNLIQNKNEMDDQLLVKLIIEYILNYIKTYISTNDILNEFKELYDNELVILSIKSVSKIHNEKDEKQICLLCEREEVDEFNCCCINKSIPQLNSFNFNQINYSNLIYYLNNRKMDSDMILAINVSIDKTIIRYREINSCFDQTKKIIPDTNLKLVDLFDYYTAEEKLTSQDDFKCQSCLNNVAYKKMEINKFPEILCLNLKRFRYDSSNLLSISKTRTSRRGDFKSGNFKGEKIETYVDFPINSFDLSNYSNKGKVVYELYAVCNHEGKIDSGHYTAVCKHPSISVWIEYNDEKISKNIEPTNIPTSEAYLLFYRKKK